MVQMNFLAANHVRIVGLIDNAHCAVIFAIAQLSCLLARRYQYSECTQYSCWPFARPSVGLSVCRSVRWAICGKMADWIWRPFGVMSGVGRGMGVSDGVVIVKEERAVLGW